MPRAASTTSAQPIVLVVKATGQGDYSVSRGGTVLCTGRNALYPALWLLQCEGMPMDAALVVRNADNGDESPPFTLGQYPDVRRQGVLPLPETKRERMLRRRAARLKATPKRSVADKPETPANLPPLYKRSGVWIDQRGKSKTYPQV